MKRKRRQPRPQLAVEKVEEEKPALEAALTKRGVAAAAAAELVATHPGERIRTMLELHDWHNARRQERGPGFIVAGIRSNEPYSLPKGCRLSHQTPANSRIAPVRENAKTARRETTEEQKSHLEPFLSFWDRLDARAQAEFEQQALAEAVPVKRRWYDDACNLGRETAKYFRLAILNDHFRRKHPANPALGPR